MSDDSPKPPKPAQADDLLLLALTWGLVLATVLVALRYWPDAAR